MGPRRPTLYRVRIGRSKSNGTVYCLYVRCLFDISFSWSIIQGASSITLRRCGSLRLMKSYYSTVLLASFKVQKNSTRLLRTLRTEYVERLFSNTIYATGLDTQLKWQSTNRSSLTEGPPAFPDTSCRPHQTHLLGHSQYQ